MRLDNLSVKAQFLLTAAVILCGAMLTLGSWISAEIRDGMLKSSGSASAVLMEGFLEPFVQAVAEQGEVAQEDVAALDRLFTETVLGDSMVSVKIWSLDGTILYNTDIEFVPESVGPGRLARAASGELVVNFEHGLDNHPDLNYPFVEIYAPLYRHNSNQILAIGEFHRDGTFFVTELDRVWTTTWLVVGAVTLAILVAMYLVVARASRTIKRQQQILIQQTADALELSRQNETLRKASEQGRSEAAEAHEALLGRIGADLHDGPIQVLTMLVMRLTHAFGKKTPDQRKRWQEPEALEQFVSTIWQDMVIPTKAALDEIRSISEGLVLPEISDMGLRQVLELVVSRHEERTGTMVSSDLEALPRDVPHPVGACLYRVIQEALSNATRHGGGTSQKVLAATTCDTIVVEVSDEGSGFLPSSAEEGSRNKLGLVGMRARVAALKGTLETTSHPGGGTRVRVTLPTGTPTALGHLAEV
jgi:signal transduction histidine kinase